jgi:hypothetical protein
VLKISVAVINRAGGKIANIILGNLDIRGYSAKLTVSMKTGMRAAFGNVRQSCQEDCFIAAVYAGFNNIYSSIALRFRLSRFFCSPFHEAFFLSRDSKTCRRMIKF